MERNNEQVKNVWKPLCLVLAALLALSWVFFGFLYSKGGVNFSTLENPEQSYTADNGGMVIGESTGNGVSLMSAKIAPEYFAENGISEQAESAYLLTATITPDNADNKAVDWSVSFVNPASEWATGKTVTDYVTVTPTADGALTANVECLQVFGEQIKVTVISRDNENATADCMVDYAKRVTFACGRVSLLAGFTTLYVTCGDNDVVSFDFSGRGMMSGSLTTFDLITTGSKAVQYSDFTIDDTFVPKLTFIPSAEYISAMASKGYTISPNEVVVTRDSIPSSLGVGSYFGLTGIQNCSDYAAAKTACVSVLKENPDLVFMKGILTVTGTYSTYSFECSYKASSTSLNISVESVSLDQTDVII